MKERIKMRIPDIIEKKKNEGKPSFSFEIFPPKKARRKNAIYPDKDSMLTNFINKTPIDQPNSGINA